MEPHANKVWTYDDLLAIPYDGIRREIFDGELVVSPSPTLRHQRVVIHSTVILFRELEQRGLARVYPGPVDVVITNTRVFVPDAVAVSLERKHLLEEQCIRGGPDLVVEVISPSSKKRDRVAKRRMYEQAGVAEYWIIDPKRDTIEVLVLKDGVFLVDGQYMRGQKLRSVRFGIELSVDELLAE